MFNPIVQQNDLSFATMKQIVGVNRNKVTNYYNQVVKHKLVEQFIGPNIQDIEYILNVTKWTIEFFEIISAATVFGTIYDRMKWIIVDHTFCIWLGAVWKCDYGIHMSFIGLMVAMYSLTMSISMQYMDLPPLMIFREIDLNAFRLGLWWSTSKNLFYWYNKKITEKYKEGRYRPIDRVERMKLYDLMIGAETRRVRRSWRWTIRFICLNLMIRIFEIFIKSVKKNMEDKKNF
jgi:hypothetical protein